MTEITQALAREHVGKAAEGEESPVVESTSALLDRTGPLLGLFLSVGFVVFIAAFLTVHHRPSEELLANKGSLRSFLRISHWLKEGYFHYCGLLIYVPEGKYLIYRSSTGGYMVSAFVLQKIYFTVAGRYSWRLNAIHNQIISLLLSAFLGLLAFRISRRLGLDARLAFAAGASVVIVVFTFPDNLGLYWEMSTQAFGLLFATVFLLVEERCVDGPRTPIHTGIQASAAFLMTYTEGIAALAFLCAIATSILILEPKRGAWRRFFLIAVVPCLAAYALYGIQLFAASRRFPNVPMAGSNIMSRTGLDGESLFYGDHLDIVKQREWARNNWPVNREYLFRWKWVFILGSLSTFIIIAAYAAGRAPRIAVEALTWLVGAWLFYAALFSQAVVIHPYLYDVLLFAPLSIALFAFLPALVEPLTRRRGAILLVAVFAAAWYSLFQMRLYALRHPLPNTKVGTPIKASDVRTSSSPAAPRRLAGFV